MVIIGVTGSIGTGKSFISSCFKRIGFPVFNADECVHQLLLKNKHVIADITKIFPKALKNNQINRTELRQIVKGKPENLKRLELILHPKVREEELQFLNKCRRLRCRIAVLDIPLLFEAGAELLCNFVIVTYANEKIQQARVLNRKTMGKDFFNYIKKLQMEQKAKCDRADLVIDSSRSKAYNLRVIKRLAKKLVS